MTALSEYQRLEAAGIWRAKGSDQRRDVIVSLGNATLVIYDGAARPLAHWSLPALERINPGDTPALFRPGADSPEELEVSDPELLAAIDRIGRSLRRSRPHHGRLRLAILAGIIAAIVALGVLWLPGALVRHAASIVPDAKRADLGERLLIEVRRLTGKPCAAPLGAQALTALQSRLDISDGRLAVLPGGIAKSAQLPGGLILLSHSLVEDHEDPAVAAGYVLAETVRAATRDPLEALLSHAGPGAAFQLLTTGDLPAPPLAAYAETLTTAPAWPVSDAALLTAFANAGVPSSPYAYAEDITGETTVTLIEADPVDPLTAIPVLRDADWVSLQAICGA